MKKTTSLILLLSMLAALVSCAAKAPNPSETTAADTAETTSAEETTAPPEYVAPDVDYEGADFTVSVFDGSYTGWILGSYCEFYTEEENGDPINDAIYKRNLYTEHLLEVKLNFVHNEWTGNSANAMTNWCSKVKNMMDDPSTPVDIMACYSRNLSTGISLLAIEGALMAKEGKSAQEIYDACMAKRDKVNASFVLDTVDYLAKGGRCSAVTAFAAGLLKLRLCIEVKDGKMDVCKKYRGKMSQVLTDYVRDGWRGR